MRLLRAAPTAVLFTTAVLAFAAIPGAASAEIVPGEVVVRFKPASPPQAKVRTLTAAQAKTSAPLGLPGVRRVELASEQTTVAALAELNSRANVLWAEPNYVVRPSDLPNDPFFADGSLWGLRNTGQTVPQVVGDAVEDRAGVAGRDIGIAGAWEQTTGSDDVLVGVADTGVARHQDLNANLDLDLSRDFRAPEGGSADPTADADGHGTHVAGTIGAVGDNALGVAGVNWDVGLVGLRVLGVTGTSADIAAGFAYAGQLGLPVVNASLGTNQNSRAIADAVRLAPGTLFVVAAGNDGRDNDNSGNPEEFPCVLPYDNVICVAATGNVGDLAPFSNWGVDSVDLGAPGNQVISTVPEYDTHVNDFPVNPDVFTDGDWTTGPAGQEWEVRQADIDGDMFDVLAGNPESGIPDGVDNFVTSRRFSLVGRRGCTVRGYYDAGVGDASNPQAALVFERSIDDGVSWQKIGVVASSTEEGAWPEFEHDLKADGRQFVKFRMRLVGAETISGDPRGVRVFDPFVRCIDEGGPGTYELESGTSMASPQVAGAAALLLSEHPNASTDELREALLSTTTSLPSLSGKTVTGGALNVTAALEALASEPEPTPPSPDLKPLRVAVWPGWQRLRRFRGVAMRVTSSAPAAVAARAVVRWRGGLMRLTRLLGGETSPRNERARMARPGRITTLRLFANGRRVQRLRRIQRSGRPLIAHLAVRFYAPGHERPDVVRRRFRLR